MVSGSINWYPVGTYLIKLLMVTLQKEMKIRKFYPTNILIQNMAVTCYNY
jgi:hypothetical protein